MGRGEDFFTYQGFSRTISFAFRVVAGSKEELRPMYNRLNNLLSQVYPDYSNAGIMRAPLVKLTIGDYIFRTPGFLENVNVTIDNGNTPWEIVLAEYTDTDVRQLPHMVSVQCSFKPIMDLLPRKQDYSNPFVPLIANRDHYLDPVAKGDPVKQNVPFSTALKNETTQAGTNVGTTANTTTTTQTFDAMPVNNFKIALPTTTFQVGKVDVKNINTKIDLKNLGKNSNFLNKPTF
jgi:hypothetical protein